MADRGRKRSGVRAYFRAVRGGVLLRLLLVGVVGVVSIFYALGASQQGPLQGVRIAVDAGHGGEDRGVCYFEEALIEKEINLDMAHRLATALESMGATVLLTRSDDTFIPLAERAAMANQFHADLFISLHVNRIPGHPNCFGAQTFYFPSSVQGERLASSIQQELLKVDPDNYREPMAGSFAVLRQSEMPGALVEIAFMTNARDRALLHQEEYRTQVTEAIVRGILDYLQGDTDLQRDSDAQTDTADQTGADDE